jgi:hypothetical protein
MEKVQQHLIRVAELSRAAADAMAARNENLVREPDSLVEHARKSAPSELFASIANNTAADRLGAEEKWVTFA